jgi:hypothetical protein
MNKLAIVALTVLCTTPLAGQESSLRQLSTTSMKALSVPAFSSTHPGQCDSLGNLYFQLSNGTERFDGSYIMRLAVESETPTVYAIPLDLAKLHEAWVNFSVSLNGKVSILDEDGTGQMNILSYDANGRVISQVKLETPDQLDPRDLFVYDSGVILLSGYYGPQAPPLARGKTYTALFEPTGKLRKVLEAESNLFIDLMELKRKPLDSTGVIGPDQLLYYARSNHISAIREDGTVVRRFSFSKPADTDTVASIKYSDGLLSVEFVGMTAEHTIRTQFLVLDVKTGDRVGFYTHTADQGNNSVCFSRHDGYTFFRIENGKVKLVTASM